VTGRSSGASTGLGDSQVRRGGRTAATVPQVDGAAFSRIPDPQPPDRASHVIHCTPGLGPRWRTGLRRRRWTRLRPRRWTRLRPRRWPRLGRLRRRTRLRPRRRFRFRRSLGDLAPSGADELSHRRVVSTLDDPAAVRPADRQRGGHDPPPISSAPPIPTGGGIPAGQRCEPDGRRRRTVVDRRVRRHVSDPGTTWRPRGGDPYR
jgi:hypothetical protein